ncbi:MAG TPA: hypothetical protein VFH45_12270 [Acidimicrobiales bacterium]|nr:hypothetical protein [Acidimicrobiales bacterium]
MQLIEARSDSAVVELSATELRLLSGVLLEAIDGDNSIPEEDWPMLVGRSRADALRVSDELFALLRRLDVGPPGG